MKEASGELSMTLIVIIAAGVILTLFLAFRGPITNSITNMWSRFGGVDTGTCTTDANGKTTCTYNDKNR